MIFIRNSRCCIAQQSWLLQLWEFASGHFCSVSLYKRCSEAQWSHTCVTPRVGNLGRLSLGLEHTAPTGMCRTQKPVQCRAGAHFHPGFHLPGWHFCDLSVFRCSLAVSIWLPVPVTFADAVSTSSFPCEEFSRQGPGNSSHFCVTSPTSHLDFFLMLQNFIMLLRHCDKLQQGEGRVAFREWAFLLLQIADPGKYSSPSMLQRRSFVSFSGSATCKVIGLIRCFHQPDGDNFFFLPKSLQNSKPWLLIYLIIWKEVLVFNEKKSQCHSPQGNFHVCFYDFI